MGVSKVDRELFRAKYGNDPVEYFKHLPDVESVEVFQDEIKVNYKRDSKHIFREGRSVIIPVKVKR